MNSESELRLVKTETKEVRRPHEVGDGTRAIAYCNILKELSKTMQNAERSPKEIGAFQKDFLQQNGVNVPETFLFCGDRGSVNSFFDTLDGNFNVTVASTYKQYEEWCCDNGFITVSKGEFINTLKNGEIEHCSFSTSGTINGLTYRNVVKVRPIRQRDTVGTFVKSQTVQDDKSRIKCSDLFALYESFCRNSNLTPLSKTAFKKEMIGMGYFTRKYNGFEMYKGLTMKEGD